MTCITDCFRPNTPQKLADVKINPAADILAITISAPDKLQGIIRNSIRNYAIGAVMLANVATASIAYGFDIDSSAALTQLAFLTSFAVVGLTLVIDNDNIWQQTASVIWKERTLYCWSPLGSLLSLGAFAVLYHIGKLFPELLLIPSIKLFPILLLYSIPAILLVSYSMYKIGGLRYNGFNSPLPNAIAVTIGMLLTSVIVHLPQFGSLMPGYLIGLDYIYFGDGRVEYEAMMISIYSAAWIGLVLPTIDAIDIGWNRVHEDWKHSLAVRILASGIITGGVTVAVWKILSETGPYLSMGAFESITLAIGLYIYVYGIITTPTQAPHWT